MTRTPPRKSELQKVGVLLPQLEQRLVAARQTPAVPSTAPAAQTGTLERLIDSGEWDNLPDIESARLPVVYQAAKTALANCERIDECKDWADKHAALASYAKQSGDDSLFKLAMRIQARATQRCGELLKQIPSGQGSRNQHKQPPVGTVTRQQAADDAGMSERQRVTALRVAAVPRESFEAQVESDNPPTITALANQGRVPMIDLGETKPADFALATAAIGTLRRFAIFCTENDAAQVAAGVKAFEGAEIRDYVATVDAWLEQFITRIEE